MSPDVSKRNVANDAVTLSIGKVVTTLAEVLVPIAAIRLLGKRDVADLGALLLIYNLIVLMFCAGMPAALMFFAPNGDLAFRKRVVQMFLRLAFGAGLLASGILVVLSNFQIGATALISDAPVDLGPLKYVAIYAPLDLCIRLLPNILVIESRTKPAAFFSVLRGLLVSLGTITPILLGGDAVSVALSLVIAGAILFTIVLRKYHTIYASVTASHLEISYKRIIHFLMPLTLSQVVAVIHGRVDKLLVLTFLAAETFAEFQAGAWQIPILPAIAYSVGDAIAPSLSISAKETGGETTIAIFRKALGSVALLVVPVSIAFAISSTEVITLAFGSAYTNAIPVFLCYALMLTGRLGAYGTALAAIGAPRLITAASIVTLVLNLAFSIPALHFFGMLGPALGTVLGFFPSIAFQSWALAKTLHVPLSQTFPVRRWLTCMTLAAVSAGMSYLVTDLFISSLIISLAVKFSLTLTLYAMGLRIFGVLTKAEVTWLKNLIQNKV